MAKILVVLEQRDGVIRGSSKEALTAAAAVADGPDDVVEAFLAGGEGIEGAADEAGRYGASRVLVASHEALADYHPDGYSRLAHRVAEEGGYDVVLLAATAGGKDLAPRLAALLDVPLAQDVVELRLIDGALEVVRPVYAGKALARVRLDATPGMASLRPNAVQAEERPAGAEVVRVELGEDPGAWPTEILRFEATAGDIPDVSEADTIVSGGRGLGDPEHWEILEELRAALGTGAGLGASRAVVDAGWRPHAEQVGQTGKTVSPRLYFAIGISGAIQHLAGMRTAGTIVAVNRDPDAPIFKVADYGIVGDLFDVVPRLADEIRKLKRADS